MSGRESDGDSDAPEEFTVQQGMQQDVEIRKVQLENKARVVREVKERRKKWTEKLTPRPVSKKESKKDETDTEKGEESQHTNGMLPDDIVNLLVANEKKVFSSDSEDDEVEKLASKKKRRKKSGMEPVILKEIPPPQCVQNAMEFLKKRKMQVPRSSAVLNNSKQALRFLSKSGLLK